MFLFTSTVKALFGLKIILFFSVAILRRNMPILNLFPNIFHAQQWIIAESSLVRDEHHGIAIAIVRHPGAIMTPINWTGDSVRAYKSYQLKMCRETLKKFTSLQKIRKNELI